MNRFTLRRNIVNDKLIINIDSISALNNIYNLLPSVIKICKDKELVVNFSDKIGGETILMKKLVEIINIKDIKQKYEFIYDYVCNYLDEEFRKKDYCNFSNNQCVANRKGVTCHKDNGCCYNKKIGLCPNLTDKGCKIKSISCKLFVCLYLEKKVKFNLKFIKLFFNNKQREIIKYSYFEDKKDVINKLYLER